ncbi:MAG TPA: hypothetical protein DD379_09665 [Cyanobacteria bacterium UBA11162]|nr:hypothetical protein [Cyanobacteria bacterium UBA11162]
MTQTQSEDFESYAKILATALVLATSDLAQFTEQDSRQLRQKYVNLATDFEISQKFKIFQTNEILIAKNTDN